MRCSVLPSKAIICRAELFLFLVRQALRSALNDSEDLASISLDNTARQIRR
jgi:hypothetical protein